MLLNEIISNLPNEICNIILSFIILDHYDFDIDSIYFTVDPLIHFSDSKLNVNITTWFGTQNPNDYKPCKILHTHFERPYPLQLEKSFGKIGKILYDNLKKYKLKNDVLERIYGNMTFAGTYGPLREGILNKNGCYWNKLSNLHFTLSKSNFLDYFKEVNILDEETYQNNPEIMNYLIDTLYYSFNLSIIESIDKYKKNTKNNIKGPYIKKINNSTKYFYKLCKPISDSKIIIEENMKQILKT